MSFFQTLSTRQYLLLVLAAVNLLGFALMGIDKARARQRAFRIPEATLFIVAVFGGSIGSIRGMFVFHHKTKKWYFLVGMPLILLLQLGLLFWIWRSPVRVSFF